MTADTCDWPGCGDPATGSLPLYPGMELSIAGVPFTGSRVEACPSHAPQLVRLVQDALESGERRARSRGHVAPGDVEWEEYFGDHHPA
jgi:hypothetical protein